MTQFTVYTNVPSTASGVYFLKTVDLAAGLLFTWPGGRTLPLQKAFPVTAVTMAAMMAVGHGQCQLKRNDFI